MAVVIMSVEPLTEVGITEPVEMAFEVVLGFPTEAEVTEAVGTGASGGNTWDMLVCNAGDAVKVRAGRFGAPPS